MPGVSLEKPEGAFYAFPSVQEAMDKMGIKTSREFCDKLLQETYVAAVPGEDFGAPGSIRLSYALPLPRVEEALERMAKFVGG